MAEKQNDVDLVLLSSGKYRLTVNGNVVADEVEFSEAVKLLEPDNSKGENNENN